MGSAFFNTIILLGSLQGFIISTLLFCSKKNKQSNHLLSVLILLISLASFNLYASYVNWFNSGILTFISNFIPMVVVMPFGPLLYFYLKIINARIEFVKDSSGNITEFIAHYNGKNEVCKKVK